ncbi:MAG TPA: alpha-L-rhamnosidase C-terminal domain-containing protein [Bacteroidales bacterium]|nr:alpha-L-rhamnosidase C-terminal domain-containing protein [Bacteroidales bacterium]
MKLNRIFLCLVIACYAFVVQSQPVSPDLLNKPWEAKWITVPGAPENGYGVYLFRKLIDVSGVPASYVIHVSADNRYKLYVNEKLVSVGPARGDYYYWNYETVDIAPYLVEGRNIVAAKIWNEGNLRPEAQISWKTGFILQSDSPSQAGINTNDTWKCIRDTSYQPLTTNEVIGYYVTGPGEFIDMRKNMEGWNRMSFNDSTWKKAGISSSRGAPKGIQDAFGWMLVPSSIPERELTVQRLQTIRLSKGWSITQSFPAIPTKVTVPANTSSTLLLDNGNLTNAYLTLIFSNGKDASIQIKYAEALFIPAGPGFPGGYMGSEKISGKGNRNEIDGKLFLGRKDSLISDGTLGQEFTSLYWRTYRYIQLTVQTHDDPLVIDDIFGTFTGYPFVRNGLFVSNNPEFQNFLDIGWRTARLCAVETYVDCPYYEQLQYIGDTRIQAMVSYYNTGDDRLARNAMNLMDHSRIAEGITLSRHPSFSPQLIPTFSLWYIGMLHDYYMYRPDSIFIKDKISGTRQILDFFHRYQQADGSLKSVPYWNFTDWVPEWNSGVAPAGANGSSCVYDLQLLWAYQLAAHLEKSMGMKAMGELYETRAQQLASTIGSKYWSDSKGLFADTPEKDKFSQHANALAILTGVAPAKKIEDIAAKLVNDKTLTPASIYFKYYLHMALIKAGLGNNYMNWLDIWRENIKMGLTTWAEDSQINTARSDCHAWGASPNIEFFRTILGIDTDAPGFSKVKIEPHLGSLKNASGEIQHPAGKIAVKYVLEKGKWNIEITLPQGLTGRLIWKGQTNEIKEGLNKFLVD